MGELLTAEEFVYERFEFPDGGRFSELVAGELKTYQPPDIIHGNVIFNLTKQLGNYLHQTEQGYACYELGLVTIRNPDTIRFPSVTVYLTGERFAQLDFEMTEIPPAMVIEVASTHDRRREMETRVAEYQQCGVQLLWIIDPETQELLVLSQQGEKQHLSIDAQATTDLLPELSIEVSSLFEQPGWIR